MQVLFIGDVFGKPGRSLVAAHLPGIRSRFDFVIANGENAAGGFGLNEDSFETLTGAGVDVITLGNHTWDNKEVLRLVDDPRVLRPLNYPAGAPGRGWGSFRKDGERLTVLNAMGRVFMDALDDPFRATDEALEGHEGPVVVDFHAEATSEKIAFGWHLDGRVAAVVGTHTHVATADTRLLPGGTAFQTDVGMTGPLDSVIGMDPNGPVQRFMSKLPTRFGVASGPSELNAVAISIEGERATAVRRYRYREGWPEGRFEGGEPL
ncbi:MAG TPA: TIGR00282 family metallophosphoesterase [Deinococcales bacterium]|nr:TIGR00282 family metallophosphoesterase [Deinococcales bacterium]